MVRSICIHSRVTPFSRMDSFVQQWKGEVNSTSSHLKSLQLALSSHPLLRNLCCTTGWHARRYYIYVFRSIFLGYRSPSFSAIGSTDPFRRGVGVPGLGTPDLNSTYANQFPYPGGGGGGGSLGGGYKDMRRTPSTSAIYETLRKSKELRESLSRPSSRMSIDNIPDKLKDSVSSSGARIKRRKIKSPRKVYTMWNMSSATALIIFLVSSNLNHISET